MCDMCDGLTLEESTDRMERKVRQYGWAFQSVEPEEGRPGFVYSIGLLTGYGHPELLMIDHNAERAGNLVNQLGGLARDGIRLLPGSIAGCPNHLRNGYGAEIELVRFHPHHLTDDGPMTQWFNVVRRFVNPPPALIAYQIHVPDLIPHGDRQMGVRLDQPHARL